MKYRVTTGSYRIGKDIYDHGDIVDTDLDLQKAFGKECFELVPDEEEEEEEQEEQEEEEKPPQKKRKATRRRRKQ